MIALKSMIPLQSAEVRRLRNRGSGPEVSVNPGRRRFQRWISTAARQSSSRWLIKSYNFVTFVRNRQPESGVSRLIRLNSNKGTKSLTRVFATFYDRRTFGNSAAPKIGACLVDQFWGLNTDPYSATDPPKSRALPEWVAARVLSLDAVEQAYQEAVQGGQHLMDTQRCRITGV